MTAQDVLAKIEQGRSWQAEEWARAALGQRETPAGRYLLGLSLLRQGRFGEAERELRRAVEQRPGRAMWRRDLAEALASLFRYREAIAELEGALAIDDRPAWRINLAHAARAVGDLERARTELERVAASGELTASGALALGQVYQESGNPERALPMFEKATALEPGSADARLGLGAALTRLERYDEALAALDALVALHPWHAGAVYNRAVVLQRLGRESEAAAAFERFTTLSTEEDRLDNARSYLATHPEDSAVRIDLARELAGSGRTDEARELLRVLFQRGSPPPDAVELWDSLTGT